MILFLLPHDLYWIYGSGFLLFSCFALQIVLGVFLAGSFISGLNGVWAVLAGLQDGGAIVLCRGLHSIMTSVIFAAIYMHIIKPLILNSLSSKSTAVWIVGWLIMAALIVAAFLGYVLPLTQISYWGLIVFIKIINAIPIVGNSVAGVFLGGEFINALTYSRVAVLHVAVPFIIMMLAALHVTVMHWNNSSDPLGFGGGAKSQQLFLLWFGLRDALGAVLVFMLSELMLLVFISVVSHEEGFQFYNQLVTPEKILPEWFFLPLFGIIKGISHQAFALAAAGGWVFKLLLNFMGRKSQAAMLCVLWGWWCVLCWVVFGLWGGVVVLVWPVQPVLRIQLSVGLLLCLLS